MIASLLATLSLSAANPIGDPQPYNVILIMVDDLGINQLAAYRDVNQYTCAYPYPHTPNIDRLALEGMRFTQFRTSPICSPTRAQVQSSRYGRHTGCGTNVTKNSGSATFEEFNVAPARVQTTLAQALPSSFATGFFGKNHMSLAKVPCQSPAGPAIPCSIPTGDRYVPDVLGYDRYEGILDYLRYHSSDQPDGDYFRSARYAFKFYTWTSVRQTANPFLDRRYAVCGCGTPILNNCPTGPLDSELPGSPECDIDDYYCGTYITRHERLSLQSWIQGLPAEQPFFALWAMSDIHTPLTWPPQVQTDPCNPGAPPSADREGHGFGSEPAGTAHSWPVTRLRAKLETVDSSIGRLMVYLAQRDLLYQTVIIFMGDNGTQGPASVTDPNEPPYPPGHPLESLNPTIPPCGGYAYSTRPYDELPAKGSVYEGGVRTPLIVWGPPGFLGENQVGEPSDALVDAVDIYETILHITSSAYAAPTACDCSGPQDCRDGISFLPLLQGAADPDSHARQYSYNATFSPNSWDCTLGRATPTLSTIREYYVARGTGELFKLVRKYHGPTNPTNPSLYTDELYDLTTDPLEIVDLRDDPSFATEYAAIVSAFEARFRSWLVPTCPQTPTCP